MVEIDAKAKLNEITEKLEQGIRNLFDSEKYKTYLRTMSKFHNYSFNNTLLIAMQRPDASLVAGYEAWKKNFDRYVKKGSKGIKIISPVKVKIEVDDEKSEMNIWQFRKLTVASITQSTMGAAELRMEEWSKDRMHL